MDKVGEGRIERMVWKHTSPRVKQITSGNLLYEAGSSDPVLRDNPEGWDGLGGGRDGTCVYLWLIHVDIQQKQTKYCKATILQLKINIFF